MGTARTTKAPAKAPAQKKSYRFGMDVIVPTFNEGDPNDGSNVGFYLKGHVLRWLSPGVQSRRAGRIYQTLRLNDLDPSFVEQWRRRYNYIESDGGTIRRNEMVLAFASLEARDKVRKRNKELQRRQEGNLRTENRDIKKGLVTKIDESTETIRGEVPEGV